MMEYNKEDNKPILVQFENGPLKDESRSTVDFHYLCSTAPKSNKRMLVSNCENMLYTGNVVQKQQNLVKYYLGVVDKHTRRIENVHAVQLCTLKPKLKDAVKHENVNKDKKSYREETDTLVEAFGSAKQKRLVASRKKNVSVNESVSDKVCDVAKKILLESPKTPTVKTEDGEDEFQQIIPTMHKDAKIPSEIYHIADIISDDDYRFLLDHAKEMTYCDNATLLWWKNEQKYPEFIIHELGQLPNKKASIRRQKGCYICYLNYLIAFTKLTFKDIKKPNPCPDVPDKLRQSILDKFTNSDEKGRNRCMPKKFKDKLYCYIFILGLFIEDFDMDCNLLLRDLKLGVARVTKLLRAIGCSVKSSNLKRKADEGPSERVIRAVLETAHAKVKKEEDTTNSPTSTSTPTTTPASTPTRNTTIVKKEEPEFVLDSWK